MTKILILLIMTLLILTNIEAREYQEKIQKKFKDFSVTHLKNNKEALSRKLTTEKKNQAETWIRQTPYQTPAERDGVIHQFLEATLKKFSSFEEVCEINFIDIFINEAQKRSLIQSSKSFAEVMSLTHFLRMSNYIDDLFYGIIKDNLKVFQQFHDVMEKREKVFFIKKSTKHFFSDLDLNYIYSDFKKWPNDKTMCSLDLYRSFIEKLNLRKLFKKDSKRNSFLQRVNLKALQKNLITEEVYKKLEIFRKNYLYQDKIRLKKYLSTLIYVKDIFSQSHDQNEENHFPTTFISKKNRISQREYLYRNFSSTQIIILSSLLEKTSQRINSSTSKMTWSLPNGEKNVYVLSPMEQYRASLKLLKKEIAELRRSEIFNDTIFTYEDILCAAFETGIINSSEIDYVLKFEDFWNPQIPRHQAYFNFVLSLTGNAVFFLPPPWNALGAIGLIWGQIKLQNESLKDRSDKSWNVII